MDISLEKIDVIRDRTGISYKEAKEALEAADGNVVDALISIEDAGSKKWAENVTESISVKGTEAMDKLKSILNAGNVSRIKVKKDEYVILDIPVTAGAIGALAIPLYTAVGAAVALLTKCTIEVERPNKEVMIINDMITNTADDIASKFKNVAGDIKKATSNMYCKDEDKSDSDDNTIYQTTVEFDTTIDTNSDSEEDTEK
ncbi:MAG: ubiquitin-associated- protein [Clostridia bacterium]|nr:ubiquitin-associated- protein [Clostridia bacterium]